MKTLMIASVFILFFSASGFCHAPADISIEVNAGNVEITVEHEVDNPENHYIDKIGLSLNGKKMIEQDFTLQEDEVEQQAIYFIPSLKRGDRIEVTAYCSRSGELKRTIRAEITEE